MDIIGVFRNLDWLLTGSKMNPARISQVRSNPTPDKIEALAWEYNLEGILRFIPDPSIIFKNADEWIKYLGTQHSLEIALGWAGFPEAKVEHQGDKVVIEIKGEPTSPRERRIRGVFNYSVPFRERATPLVIKKGESNGN